MIEAYAHADLPLNSLKVHNRTPDDHYSHGVCVYMCVKKKVGPSSETRTTIHLPSCPL